MLIYFIRHGQTDDNLNGIIQGHIDTHLNDHGRTEAAAAGRGLRRVKFDEIWSSSLSRAQETARIIQCHNEASSSDITIQSNDGLKERFLGSLQGRKRGYGEPVPRDAEPTDEFRQRIASWLASFLACHTPHTQDPPIQGRTIATSNVQTSNSNTPAESEPTMLVVSHGAYMKALLYVITHPPFSFGIKEGVNVNESCWNTSIMRVRVRLDSRDQVWKGKVLSWADVRHLEEEGEWEDVGVADDV